MHQRKAGPIEDLLGQPVQPLLVGLFGADRGHLRHRHLRDADHGVEGPGRAGHRRHRRGRLQVVRRDAHAEEHPAGTVHRGGYIVGAGKVTHDNLRTESAQLLCAVVVVTHQRPHRQIVREQKCGDGAADSTDAAPGAGDENVFAVCHCGSFLRSSGHRRTVALQEKGLSPHVLQPQVGGVARMPMRAASTRLLLTGQTFAIVPPRCVLVVPRGKLVLFSRSGFGDFDADARLPMWLRAGEGQWLLNSGRQVPRGRR